MPRMIGGNGQGNKRRFLLQMEKERLARERLNAGAPVQTVTKAGMGGLGGAAGGFTRGAYGERSAYLRGRAYRLGGPRRKTVSAEERAARDKRASESGKKAARASAEAQRERRLGDHRARQAMNRYHNRSTNLEKSSPLKTNMSEDDAKRVVARHGLKGPLPRELTREQRMAAYEARYVASGGRKGEKWQHRATVADKVRNVSLGAATGGLTAWTAARLRGKPAIAGKIGLSPRIQHHAETVTGAAGAVGGAAELYAGHARRRRASYASAPGGVAASALRRMRDYDTESR